MMTSEKVKIVNPHHGVKWKEILALLKEEQPGALNILMEVGSLIDYLDSCVAHIVVHRHKLLNSGIPRQEAEKMIIYKLLPTEIHNKKGRLKEQALEDLLSSLEDREVEIEVF